MWPFMKKQNRNHKAWKSKGFGKMLFSFAVLKWIWALPQATVSCDGYGRAVQRQEDCAGASGDQN